MEDNEKEINQLTTAQKKALPILVSHPTIREGCKKAGISRNTFYRWSCNPYFQGALNQHLDQLGQEAMNILGINFEKAVSCLVGLMDTKDPVLKRRVCNDLINHYLRVKEYQDFEERLQKLERIVKERKL